jgi:hypothetical protein
LYDSFDISSILLIICWVKLFNYFLPLLKIK